MSKMMMVCPSCTDLLLHVENCNDGSTSYACDNLNCEVRTVIIWAEKLKHFDPHDDKTMKILLDDDEKPSSKPQVNYCKMGGKMAECLAKDSKSKQFVCRHYGRSSKNARCMHLRFDDYCDSLAAQRNLDK